jgi:hypothetical protein
MKTYSMTAINKRMDLLLTSKIKKYVDENPDVTVGDTVEEEDGSSLPFDTLFALLDKSEDSMLDFQEFVGLFELLGARVLDLLFLCV